MKQEEWVGLGLILGAGIGTLLGILFKQFPVSGAVGAGIGIVIGAIIGNYKAKK